MKARHSPALAYRPRRAPLTVEDHDACALYAAVHKRAEPTHEAIEAALVALEKMLHRAGNVDGEGDGCGLLIDIPRDIWAEAVRSGGHASKLALDPRFAVLHAFIPRQGGKVGQVQAQALGDGPGSHPRAAGYVVARRQAAGRRALLAFCRSE